MHPFNKAGWLAVLAAGLVMGCGGGGSTPAATATVAGTAATGAAIASGTVTLKCVSGTTTAATTGTDGSFNIDVSGVTLPCVGRVDYKDASGAAQKLHTFISAAGTANITPVTELLVANLTGGTPADAFDKFDATKAKAITAAQIKTAADAVKTYLKNTLGVDTTKLPDDPVGTKLKAAVGSAAGDDFDKVLDDLAAKLKAKGKKLSDANDDVKSGSSGGGGTAGGASLGTAVVSGASNAKRNGTYTPIGAVFPNTAKSETAFNGYTSDGEFEIEVVWGNDGAIKRAHIWFRVDSSTNIFFGCDGGKSIACTGVGYEPLTKQILLNSAKWSEVKANLDGSGSDSVIPGGESLTISATFDVSKPSK